MQSADDSWVKGSDSETGQTCPENELTRKKLLDISPRFIDDGTYIRESCSESTPHFQNIDKIATIFVHRSDPFSLKLLIWLSEVKILKHVEMIYCTDSDEIEMKSRYSSLVEQSVEIEQGSISSRDMADTALTYPTAVFDDHRIVSGADRIIKCFAAEGYYSRYRLAQCRNHLSHDIEWDKLTVFNFYSCGLLAEVGNMMAEHREDDDFSPEYLKLHEENIHLQLYLNAENIKTVREDRSLRREISQLKEVNAQLMRDMERKKSMYSTQRVNALEEINLILAKENERLVYELNESKLNMQQTLRNAQTCQSEYESTLDDWMQLVHTALRSIPGDADGHDEGNIMQEEGGESGVIGMSEIEEDSKPLNGAAIECGAVAVRSCPDKADKDILKDLASGLSAKSACFMQSIRVLKKYYEDRLSSRDDDITLLRVQLRALGEEFETLKANLRE